MWREVRTHNRVITGCVCKSYLLDILVEKDNRNNTIIRNRKTFHSQLIWLIQDNVIFLDKCGLKIKYRTWVEVLHYLGSGGARRPEHAHHCLPGILQ